MARLIGEHYEGDVKVSWRDDGDQIGIHYSQDVDPVIEEVALLNSFGGTPMKDGLGGMLWNFPISLIIQHAVERGIPWEKLAYAAGDEYKSEWQRMGRKWSKFSIDQKRKYL